jgi:hypothetical protein
MARDLNIPHSKKCKTLASPRIKTVEGEEVKKAFFGGIQVSE